MKDRMIKKQQLWEIFRLCLIAIPFAICAGIYVAFATICSIFTEIKNQIKNIINS